MPEANSLKIEQSIEKCYLRQLSRNYDEKEYHLEYDLRKNSLDINILTLRENLGNVVSRHEINAAIISMLLILYKELQSKGEWNTENSSHYALLLNSDFERLYEVSLQNMLFEQKTEAHCDSQQVFDLCLEKLHNKLSREDFKKYPSLVQVYGLLLRDLKAYKVKVNPLKTLPISLLLIDDYIASNITVGLECCIAVFNTLAPGDLAKGNYYEVIYESLKKSMQTKDLEVTKLTLECLMKFLTLLSSDLQVTMTDDTFLKILDETQMETNFHRKVELLKIMKPLITMHSVNCVKRKKRFNAMMIENLDLCMKHSMREVLLGELLELLETWIKHCWCAWEHASDKNILSALLKVLCASGDIEKEQQVQDLIVALISLCKESDRNEITCILKSSSIQNERFTSRLKVIVQNVVNKFK